MLSYWEKVPKIKWYIFYVSKMVNFHIHIFHQYKHITEK
jgi:hypothetical protein